MLQKEEMVFAQVTTEGERQTILRIIEIEGVIIITADKNVLNI